MWIVIIEMLFAGAVRVSFGYMSTFADADAVYRYGSQSFGSNVLPVQYFLFSSGVSHQYLLSGLVK